MILVMQENHSFDNYFGKYPGADGIPLDVCMPVDPAAGQKGACVQPFHLDQNATENLAHNATVFRRQYRGGRMTGFVAAHREVGRNGSLAMGYYDGQGPAVLLEPGRRLRACSTAFSAQQPAAASGTTCSGSGRRPGTTRTRIPASGWGDMPTIFDRLEATRDLVEVLRPELRSGGDVPQPGGPDAQVARVPLLAYARYLDDPKLAAHIVDLDEYYQDLRKGTLAGRGLHCARSSERASAEQHSVGQWLVRSLVTELMRSTAWSSSAFMLTYSNWGGWYDHVAPPLSVTIGYGFRVPALLVSPYARQGHIESSQLDFTSILRFIEDNYGLSPLTERDRGGQFDCARVRLLPAATCPRLVSSERGDLPNVQPRRSGVYAAYGGGTHRARRSSSATRYARQAEPAGHRLAADGWSGRARWRHGKVFDAQRSLSALGVAVLALLCSCPAVPRTRPARS